MKSATSQQIDLLQHTLGLRIDKRTPYRNYFVADPGHHDMPDLEALEALGLMRRGRTPSFCNPSDIVFLATEAGELLAINSLPPVPKRTRYGEYVRIDGDESFGEFLCGSKLPKFEREGRLGSAMYRMYREQWDGWRPWRDVQGEWRTTKKEAKASYKLALAEHRSKVEGAHDNAELRQRGG